MAQQPPQIATDDEDAHNFLSYIEGMGYKNMDPLSKEALDIQARYISALPQHPMDVLRRIMVNPFCSPNERISAAKTVMEYSMRKVPSSMEVSGQGGGPIRIDAKVFDKLTDDELETLQTILAKAAENG